jgi:hypothetical protein
VRNACKDGVMINTASEIVAFKDSDYGCIFCVDCANEWPFPHNALIPLTEMQVLDNPSAMSCERCGDGLLYTEWMDGEGY